MPVHEDKGRFHQVQNSHQRHEGGDVHLGIACEQMGDTHHAAGVGKAQEAGMEEHEQKRGQP